MRRANGGGSGKAWNVDQLDLMATSNSSTLKFAAVGRSDSYGGAPDHVSLRTLPFPSAAAAAAAARNTSR